MKTKKFFVFIFLINLFFAKSSFSQDIPIIVIAPGKSLQSYSAVGSSVSVIDNKDVEN